VHKFHPIADLFPFLEGPELEELAEDIKADGLRDKIVLYQDMILDGRNRHQACGLAGIEPEYEPYNGNDPIKFVISKNLKRRHLTTSQRAEIASELTNMPQGYRSDLEPSANLQKVSVQQAADLMQVGARSVATAKTITDPDLKEAVKSGKKTVHAAAKAQKARGSSTKKGSRAARPVDDKIRKAALERKSKEFWQRFRE
jgi:hypothetical protein